MDVAKLFSLEGRVALVTGGYRGIGRMMAEGLLGAGCARVYVTGRKAEALAAAAAGLGPRCAAIPGDIATLDGIAALAEALTAREPHLDILVNNAGVAWGAPFGRYPEDGWDRTLDLNLKTPFFLTQQLRPLLAAAGAGGERPAKVIMISSVDGQKINPWETYAYQASKAGLIHLTRRMAARLVRDNIVVSGIAPGHFPSQMNRAAIDPEPAFLKAVPARRMGTAEDIAAAVVYLASRAGDYVVGETLTVDGGLVNSALPDEFPSAGG
ncbi:MAG: SDR family oxidoreductase [Sphingomonadales bacterium]|nr:SDR family oxidoreductase [Sphingomonadales bacterium]MBU3992934.1 SDR family oxidoreductase [Alphaproteobacteria bacterium]